MRILHSSLSILIITTILFLSGCSDEHFDSPVNPENVSTYEYSASDYHPLAVGNYWKYKVIDYGEILGTIEYRVTGRKEHLGEMAFRILKVQVEYEDTLDVDVYFQRFSGDTLFFCNEEDSTWRIDYAISLCNTKEEGEFTWLEFNLVPGLHSVHSLILEKGVEVTLNEVTYSDCLVLKYEYTSYYGLSSTYLTFAPGVGYIRQQHDDWGAIIPYIQLLEYSVENPGGGE